MSAPADALLDPPLDLPEWPHHLLDDGTSLPLLCGFDQNESDDPLRPWAPWRNVGNEEACQFLGWSSTQLKRARLARVIPYYMNRGRPTYLAADLYAYKDSLRVEAEASPKIRRTRTAEHNAKIAAGVRAAAARKATRS